MHVTRFDGLKDADGFISKEQFLEAAPPEEATGGAAEGAAPAAAEAAPTGGGKVVTPLEDMQKAIEETIKKGLTPMIIDSSAGHAADAFFGYNATMLDAKQLSLDVAQKKKTQEESLEEARKTLVGAMKFGKVRSRQAGRQAGRQVIRRTMG